MITVSLPGTLPMSSALALQFENLNGLDGSELLRSASSQASQGDSSDRASLTLRAIKADLLPTETLHSMPQKTTTRNRKARRSRRLKIKRVGLVKRQRGFGAVKGSDNAPRQPESPQSGNHRPPKRHHRHHKLPTDPISGLPQATFNQLSAEMMFGAPTDIAAGWDGTLSAIDPSGAHHLYDSIGDAWNPSDGGIDAIALDWVNKRLYCFQGSQYITIDLANNNQTSDPTEIATTWPTLPYSFTLGVTGATFAPNGKFYLFNGGRYVPTDGSAAPVNLADWSSWPVNNSTFGPSVIDGVIAEYKSGGILVVRGNEGLAIDLVQETIIQDSAPLSQYYGQGLPLDWQSSGINTGVWTDVHCVHLFKGPAMLTLTGSENSPVTPFYIPTFPLFSNWPIAWHPRLVQAPSGRIGNLWSVDASNNVYHHDGTAWSVIAGWSATSISVGQDGTTVYLSPYAEVGNNWQTDVWQVVAGVSQELTSFPGNAVQILVGNAEQIWIRDNQNNVYLYDLQQKSWNAVDLGMSPTATAVAADGTLWHNDNQGNAYRFLAGGNTKPVAGITNVQKLTTTGYGATHCLVQQDNSTQLYRYDSPYVFKSSQGYSVSPGTPIVQGLGNLYMSIYYTDIYDSSEPGQNHSYIVAVDAHTGQEVSRTEDIALGNNSGYYTGVVFDPIHELVYLTSFFNSGQSVVTAVDARDLTNKIWHFAASIIDTPPALSGAQLCFGDRTGILYLFNTSVALQAAQAANQSGVSNPELRPQDCGGWQQAIPQIGVDTSILSTPIFAEISNGQINVIAETFGSSGISMSLVQCGVQTPSNMTVTNFAGPYGPACSPIFSPISLPVTLGQSFDDYIGQAIPALFTVLNGQYVYAVPINPPSNYPVTTFSFSLPGFSANKHISTGIAYGSGLGSSDASVWFADSTGTLWGLNNRLEVVYQHHATGDDSGASIATTPFIYNTAVPASQNTGGSVTKPVVFFGITTTSYDFDWNSLYLYDPDSDNQFSIDTGSTEIAALSTSLNNGVIYAGGNSLDFVSTPELNQMFGIRVDELVQGLRDFIIESQLMQDPDDSVNNGSTDPNNPIPPSVARYQTHLTIVDDLKAPRPNEAVKIWADQPNTQITVNGQTYTIGPGDSDYASVKTGVDGTLVIVSTAGNVNTSMLRVWATFMDPFERILIFPDHEFHGRVSNSYASSSTSDTSYTDPDHPDLSSVNNYSGNSLFTADEKSAKQPQQIANATQQMRQGVNPGGSTQVKLAGVLSALQSANPNTPYVPYEDLTGMHYAPNNAIATRPVQINQATGLKLAVADPSQPYDPTSNPFSHTAINHADARTEIDNLEGTPWSPDDARLPFEGRRVGNIFSDFWNWLVRGIKKLAAEIKQVIVSIAEDVYVGLQYVWNGIKKVFKAIIKVIEDIAHAIASFFVALAKLIEDIIEALSVLFHFGEIIWTQKWIESYFGEQLLNLKQTVKTKVIPATQNFFTQGKDEIKQLFGQATTQAPTNRISQQSGVGSTTHTVYNVGQKGSNATSSRAVHCSWGTQKMKANVPSTGQATSSVSSSVGGESISDFFNGFIQSLTTGTLSEDFSNFQSSFNSMFQSTSVSGFFQNALNTFLGLIEGLLEFMLDIASGLTAGLLNIFDDVIDLLVGADGILNQRIEIPFFTWLFKQITGEKLTLLNLITLVVAIPVTIIFRVVEGQYPSQANLPQTSLAADPASNAEVTALSETLQYMLAIAGFGLGCVGGCLSAIGDSDPEAPSVIAKLSVGVSLLSISPALPLISNDSPQSSDWCSFGISVALGLLSVTGVISVNEAFSAIYGALQSAWLCMLSLGSLIISCINFSQIQNAGAWDKVALSISVFSVVAGIINPIKLITALEEFTVPVVMAFDIMGPLIAGAMSIAAANE
jgi:hypothetical protein